MSLAWTDTKMHGVLVALWKTLLIFFETSGDLRASFCYIRVSVVVPGGLFCHLWNTFGRLFVDWG